MLGGPKLVKDQLYSATFSLARALHGAIIGKGVLAFYECD
jgi:hypothetical protein